MVLRIRCRAGPRAVHILAAAIVVTALRENGLHKAQPGEWRAVPNTSKACDASIGCPPNDARYGCNPVPMYSEQCQWDSLQVPPARPQPASQPAS